VKRVLVADAEPEVRSALHLLPRFELGRQIVRADE
jgi:hypothetical protein